MLYHGAQQERRKLVRKIHGRQGSLQIHPVVITSFEIAMRDRNALQVGIEVLKALGQIECFISKSNAFQYSKKNPTCCLYKCHTVAFILVFTFSLITVALEFHACKFFKQNTIQKVK